MSNQIKIRVRLIIPHENKLLLEYVEGEDFYFYPGGKVEFGETLLLACKREMVEELGVKFVLKKILYIRDFLKLEKDEHSVEFFILGEINKSVVEKNPDDPDYKEHHRFEWVEIDKLAEKEIFPKELTPKLIADFKAGFLNQGQYLGAIE